MASYNGRMFNRRKAEMVNAVMEVGRDPMRLPEDTKPEDILVEAAKIEAARELLKKVLPPRPEA